MKSIKILLLYLTMSAPLLAQEKPQLYTIPSPFDRYSHYNVTLRAGAAIPMGQFSSDYIDKASLDNYSIGLEWVLQSPISVGAEVGYSFFTQKLPRAIYEINGQDVSAVQTRTISLIPIQGTVNYNLGTPNVPVRPYVQVSLGAAMADYSLYYGSLATQEQSVKFSYGGAVGTKILFKKDGSLGADLRIKYNNTPLKFDYIQNGVSQLNATVGIYYRWW
jgi:hypothetical protein